MKSNTKTIILYRVIQEWRAPVFQRLSDCEDLDLEVWHGPDFKGTKIISTTKAYQFKRRKLISLKLKLKSKNGIIAMPVSPFLFFLLIIKNPDVVICEGSSNIINSIIAFVYCKLFQKKYIWWSLGKLQNRAYDIKRSLIDRFVQYIEIKSHAIITYSSIGEDYFLSIGAKKEKIFKAVNVVDTEKVLSTINVKDDLNDLKKEYENKYDFIILFVGALIKEKSIDILIKAQAKLEKLNPKIGLVIVGDGNYKKQLLNLSKELNCENVEFVGKKIDDNYKYFVLGNVFVLPGLGGLAISEAMCYGLPIISSIGDGCEVDLVSPKNGIIDKAITEDSLVEHIKYFMFNKSNTIEFGIESKRIVSEVYTINNYLNQIRNAIKS